MRKLHYFEGKFGKKWGLDLHNIGLRNKGVKSLNFFKFLCIFTVDFWGEIVYHIQCVIILGLLCPKSGITQANCWNEKYKVRYIFRGRYM